MSTKSQEYNEFIAEQWCETARAALAALIRTNNVTTAPAAQSAAYIASAAATEVMKQFEKMVKE